MYNGLSQAYCIKPMEESTSIQRVKKAHRLQNTHTCIGDLKCHIYDLTLLLAIRKCSFAVDTCKHVLTVQKQHAW